MRRTLFALPLLLAFSLVHSQTPFLQRMDSVDFTEGSTLLSMPFGGGLNFPQFSNMDLNGDTLADLVVFDKAGNVVITFVNNGTAFDDNYEFAPQYAAQFPREGLEFFVLMRDYNCDGKADIFTGNPAQGIDVWVNTSTGGNISFVKTYSLLQTDYGLGPVRLFTNLGDVPAIDDVDGDGDVDVLTFDNVGQHLEWHRNMALENGNCDTLIFQVEDPCWGKIEEDSQVNTIYTGITCKGITGAGPAQPLTARHAGSSVATYDENNDGDLEVVIGDLVFPNLVFLHNAGTPTNAQVDSVQMDFPVYDSPVNINLFPAAFFADVNQDGLEDLLAGPNGSANSQNYNCSWVYENVGNASQAYFELYRKDFLQNMMIDCGSGAFPALLDYNNDGLKDLVIGDNFFKGDTINRKVQVRLYENVGTATHPDFELVTRNYANLSNVFTPAKESLSPAFGDMDNDGDMDMILGEFDGKLHYFENNAPAGTDANFVLAGLDYFGIDVGNNSMPALADMDRDGDLDLVVGETFGNLNYFENTGSAASATFSSTPTDATFGGVDVLIPCCTGFSAPVIFESAPGTYELLVGSEQGGLWHYNNIDGNLTGNFTLLDTTYGLVWEGGRTAPAMGDLNNDGVADLIVGNLRGGVAIYNGSFVTAVKEPVITLASELQLYPNPSEGSSTVSFGESHLLISSYEISTPEGRVVAQQTVSPSSRVEISANTLSPGIYFVTVYTTTGERAGKRWVISK